METLHFRCDCSRCRARLSDLLRREMEDCSRITGASITGLGRIAAGDPRLHGDLVRGRVCSAPALERYLDAIRDFMLECALIEDELDASRPQGEDLISTK